MEPSTETEQEHSKPPKRCWFARLLLGDASKQQTVFARNSQSALDGAHRFSAPTVGRGSQYRAGLSLADLKPGECGIVRRLFGPAQGRLRLLEMGLTPGTHVQVTRAAAFGGPLDIQVRGYQLSLRREEASGVWLDDPEDKIEAFAAAHEDISRSDAGDI